MNNKFQIIKNYKSKIKKLKLFNKLYFNEDNPRVSDEIYDNLKNEILKLEKKYSFLKKAESISNSVGAPLSNKFKKIKHLRPMLSLSNAFNKQDMDDFEKKMVMKLPNT